MKELSKKELESLVEIARKHIYTVEARGDLETRDNDSEDFLDVSVRSIKAALTAAYELGKESSQNKRSGRKISLTTADGIPESLSNLWYTLVTATLQLSRMRLRTAGRGQNWSGTLAG